MSQIELLALVRSRCAVLAVLFGLSCLLARRLGLKPHKLIPSALWMGAYLAFMGLASLNGASMLVTHDAQAIGQAVQTFFLSGCIIVVRPLADVSLEIIDERSPLAGHLIRIVRDVAIVWFAIESCQTMPDLPWNTKLADLSALSVDTTHQLLTLFLITLYFLGLRHGPVVALGIISICVVGIAYYFTVQFKGVPFMPSDLAGISTALSVSKGYDFILNARSVESICLAAPAVACCALMHPGPAPSLTDLVRRAYETRTIPFEEGRLLAGAHVVEMVPTRLAARLICGIACALMLHQAVVVPDYRTMFEFDPGWYWDIETVYKKRGFVPTFLTLWQDLQVVEPEGYTDDLAQQAKDALVSAYDADDSKAQARSARQDQFASVKPSIVVVMNESFADLSIFDGLRAGYQGPTFFKQGLTDTLARGDLAVSVFGGGTCNTEFELLTGVSMSYVGSGKIPYTTHDFTTTPSLVSQLHELGYVATAIHPNDGDNWNRIDTYRDMGFDDFLTIRAFENSLPAYHAGFRDSSTYQKALDLLRDNDAPQFIFDVTMANHGGYTRNNTFDEDQLNIYPQGFTDDETNQMLNEYLACINASDKDLEWFVGELRQLDRPVVLVFFGDHQPGFSDIYNDFIFPDEDDVLAHRERCYQSCYAIWANYEVAGVETGLEQDSSSEALGALALDLVGAPLTDLQKATLAAHDQLAQVNVFGYRDLAGTWYADDDATGPYVDLRRQLEYVNYLEYGRLY